MRYLSEVSLVVATTPIVHAGVVSVTLVGSTARHEPLEVSVTHAHPPTEIGCWFVW